MSGQPFRRLYGPGMSYAEPFEHSVETMQVLKTAGYSLCIVSREHALRRARMTCGNETWIDENLALDLIVNS